MSKDIETNSVVSASLDDQMRYAEALSSATILPDAFRGKPANVLIALVQAEELAESPWTIMQEMAVISGKPSFSAKFMRTRVRKAGHLIRESFDNGVARCVIIRADDPDFEHVATWDRAKAEKHGLWGKGHWAKNPDLMLANRALSECVREACYEVMGGVGYTPDEVLDFAPPTPPSRPAEVTVSTPAEAPARESVSWAGFNNVKKNLGIDNERALEIVAATVGHPVDRDTVRTLTQAEVDRATEALARADTAVEGETVDEATGEVTE